MAIYRVIIRHDWGDLYRVSPFVDFSLYLIYHHNMKKKAQKDSIFNYTVIFEPAEEGGYSVHVPALRGCHTQGETLDEAYAMAQDAIRLYISCLKAEHEEIPVESPNSIVGKVPVRM